MPQATKKTPLDGLELTAEVIWSTDAGERQAARLRGGVDLADYLIGGRLEFVSTPDGPGVVDAETGELIEDRSAAFAALLAFGADPSNHVTGTMNDPKGGTYQAGTALWKPSLRLDPNWMETMRRRSRGRAWRALHSMMDGLSYDERMARKYGWRQRLTLKLITLTMPHHAGTSSLSETRRLNRALTLLRKRETWLDVMAGGIKGVEDALDADGPHVHAHLLMLSKFINRDQLAEAWRECLDQATREAYGFGLAEDAAAFIDIRQVKKKPKPGQVESVSWEDALAEVTKYVTKPADFIQPDETGRRIPREVLLELCEVRRWPRMFELLGRARSERVNHGQAATAALDSIRRAYLAGELVKVHKVVGWEALEAWDPELDGPENLRESIAKQLRSRETGGGKRIRPPSWRTLLDQIGLPDWLRIMAERFRRGKAYRLNQLLAKNKDAFLVTIDGRAFGSPACA